MTEEERCVLDQCNQHSGIKQELHGVAEELKHLKDKIDTHYPRELVYAISLLVGMLACVTTLLAGKL